MAVLARRSLELLGLATAELTLVLTDDAAIQVLNRDYRGKDKATDVLSFAQLEGETVPVGEALVLGDVVISVDTARRQARALGHSLEVELRRLFVHGLLHLLGHDHVHGGWQARRMREAEERLLRGLTRASRPERRRRG